jgi:hypothetical protein
MMESNVGIDTAAEAQLRHWIAPDAILIFPAPGGNDFKLTLQPATHGFGLSADAPTPPSPGRRLGLLVAGLNDPVFPDVDAVAP